jgi:hypothetical protein
MTYNPKQEGLKRGVQRGLHCLLNPPYNVLVAEGIKHPGHGGRGPDHRREGTTTQILAACRYQL